MNLQNGYKVIYEQAKNGKRTFFASKTGICDPTVDKQIGDEFTISDFANRTIYEYKGKFYVTAEGRTPAYGEDGVPTDDRLSAFDEVFVKQEETDSTESSEESGEDSTTVEEPETLPETEDPEEQVEPEESEAEPEAEPDPIVE